MAASVRRAARTNATDAIQRAAASPRSRRDSRALTHGVLDATRAVDRCCRQRYGLRRIDGARAAGGSRS